MHGATPALTPTDNPAYKAASLAMQDTYGKEPIPVRSEFNSYCCFI